MIPFTEQEMQRLEYLIVCGCVLVHHPGGAMAFIEMGQNHSGEDQSLVIRIFRMFYP